MSYRCVGRYQRYKYRLDKYTHTQNLEKVRCDLIEFKSSKYTVLAESANYDVTDDVIITC